MQEKIIKTAKYILFQALNYSITEISGPFQGVPVSQFLLDI